MTPATAPAAGFHAQYGRADATLAAPNEATKVAQQNATLTPRFYTTDFAELDRLNVERHRAL